MLENGSKFVPVAVDEQSVHGWESCDLFVTVGQSLLCYPEESLILYAFCVLYNKSKEKVDKKIKIK